METEDLPGGQSVDQQENEDVLGADDLRGRVQHFHGVYLQDS